jgi:hypothetical protein
MRNLTPDKRGDLGRAGADFPEQLRGVLAYGSDMGPGGGCQKGGFNA